MGNLYVSMRAHVRSGSGGAVLRRDIVTYKQHFVLSFITVIITRLESALSIIFYYIYICAIPLSFQQLSFVASDETTVYS